MKSMLFRLLLGLCSLAGLRPAHAQAPRFWPRRAAPSAGSARPAPAVLVATANFPLAAMVAPSRGADSGGPAGNTAPRPAPTYPPRPGRGLPRKGYPYR